MHPSAQRLDLGKGLRPSSFVRRCLPLLRLMPNSNILDLPCGTGRHSIQFGALGHYVTAVDIDEGLVHSTKKRLITSGIRCRCLVADASRTLTFDEFSFDLALAVDFVDENFLSSVGRVLRIGGYLIHESYPAKGGNWSQLLPPERTEELLAPMFEIIRIEKKGAGPSGKEGERIKVLARRNG